MAFCSYEMTPASWYWCSATLRMSSAVLDFLCGCAACAAVYKLQLTDV